jgi:hypothetical protein
MNSGGAGTVVRDIDWKSAFPFTQIFRTFRVAIHPSKLILALVAMALIFFGGWVMDLLTPQDYRAVPNELTLYGLSHLAPQPALEFEQSRLEKRNELKAAHDAQLASIGKPNGTISDIHADVIRRRDERIKAARDAYKAADAATTDKQARANNRRDYDAAVSSAYSSAANEWEAAQAYKLIGLFNTFYEFEIGSINQTVGAVRNWNWIGPGGVLDSVRNFIIVGPVWAMTHHWIFFTIFFLFFLCVWSVFGGAIARIAAVHVARDEKISIRQALRFSTGKFLSFISAPIIPLLIVGAVALVVAVGGLLVNIPWVGPVVVGALFFLALAAGFVMTLVLLGLAGGFNLMYPTIAVEGSDSFDAISRSFSYLYARPWRLAFYSAVAIAYGSICYMFVRYFIQMMLTLTHRGARAWVLVNADNGAGLFQTMWPSPAAVGRLSYEVNWMALDLGSRIGAGLIMVWVYIVIGLLGAFAISFYFSANTVIYYLMRHEVDATELDDVYLEQSDEEFSETAAPSATGAPPIVNAPGEAVPVGQSTSVVTPPERTDLNPPTGTAEAPGV